MLLPFLVAAVLSVGLASKPVDVFVAGDEPEAKQFRIPALVQTGKGTLLAFAEARTDPSTDCAYKWIDVRRSTDNGTTWSSSIPAAGKGTPHLATGNPQAVYHPSSGKVVLVFGQKVLPKSGRGYCSPGDGVFAVDDGGSDGLRWGTPVNISAQLGSPWMGLIPGPGSGVVTKISSPGRIIFSGSSGPYDHDVVFYSDDAGASWRASSTALLKMDESCPTELPDGTLYISMRNADVTACDCQAYSLSKDGGETWSIPISYDSTLISPVCEGSVATAANGHTYFANPASTKSRRDTTVRRSIGTSPDGGLLWSTSTYLVAPGEVFGGYTSMQVNTPIIGADGAPYGCIVYERNVSSVAVISFSLFPLDF